MASTDQSFFGQAASSPPHAGSFAALCVSAASNQGAANNVPQTPGGGSSTGLVNTKTVAKKTSALAPTPAAPSGLTAAPFQSIQPLLTPGYLQTYPSALTQIAAVAPVAASVASDLPVSARPNSSEPVPAGISSLSTISLQQGTNAVSSLAPFAPAIPILSLGPQSPLPLLEGNATTPQSGSPATDSAALSPTPGSQAMNEQRVPEFTPSLMPVQASGQPPAADPSLAQVAFNEPPSTISQNLASASQLSAALLNPLVNGNSNPPGDRGPRTSPSSALAAIPDLLTNATPKVPETLSTLVPGNRPIDTRPLAPHQPIVSALPVIDQPNTDPGSTVQALQTTIASAFSVLHESLSGNLPAASSSPGSPPAVFGMIVLPNPAVASFEASNVSTGTKAPSKPASESSRPISSGASSRSTGSGEPLQAGAAIVDGTDPAQQKNAESGRENSGLQPAVQQAGSAVATASSAIQVAVSATANSGLPHRSDGTVQPGSADSHPAARLAVEAPASLPPGPVQMAHMVERAGQSEMRIGLNTSAFGSVEVHTVVHANEVGVSIGSEKGDLRTLLANELPGIANTLQQHNLRLSHVNFQQGSTFSNHPGRDSEQRPFARHSGSFSGLRTEVSRSERVELSESTEGLGTGLSVLA